ncbi:MAG TPA: serine hydrolase domain-containing protein [Hyphomicrobiaceae bacterium]|jgi:CubicO group peptidase (beta-lactamase class C family)|nr:serine hydrolase domain-containing protein [Hyphomicrobiaceae bacterium]
MPHYVRLFWVLFVLAAAPAAADRLATGTPASVGFASDRLQRLTEVLQSEIGKGTMPGAVLMIQRNGKVAYFEALGVQDPERKTPMRQDTIFRIYSMSKPITTTAAMMLVEQGRLALADPVQKYLPEFKDVQVGEEKPDKTLELVAPRRPMTVQDLMRHTAGLTYGFFGEGAVKKAYREANLDAGDPTTAEFVARLAKLPLVYQPGTTWDYSHATDVLGRVVEVVAGKPLSAALREMLFLPLGMTDTSFYLEDPSKYPRLAEPFAADRSIGAGAVLNDPREVKKYESGGGGLLSTTADYARFLSMLANGGELDGKRYLSPKTVAYMTSDHMGDVIKRGPYDLVGPGYKFGLGFAVRTEPGVSPLAGSPGDFTWGGAAGTYFWVDPKEKMFAIFMMQAPSKRGPLRPLLRDMVYAAMVE